MANVPGNDGETHVDLGFEIKQVRCNARDLASTIQTILQEAADAAGDAEEAAAMYHNAIKLFRLSDNDDFLVVYPESTQQQDDGGGE